MQFPTELSRSNLSWLPDIQPFYNLWHVRILVGDIRTSPPPYRIRALWRCGFSLFPTALNRLYCGLLWSMEEAHRDFRSAIFELGGVENLLFDSIMSNGLLSFWSCASWCGRDEAKWKSNGLIEGKVRLGTGQMEAEADIASFALPSLRIRRSLSSVNPSSIASSFSTSSLVKKGDVYPGAVVLPKNIALFTPSWNSSHLHENEKRQSSQEALPFIPKLRSWKKKLSVAGLS